MNTPQERLQFIAARMAALDTKLFARVFASAVSKKSRAQRYTQTPGGAQIAAEPRRNYSRGRK